MQTIRQQFGLPTTEAPEGVPSPPDPDAEVMFEMLRALATHHKMGENNHSHEDDLWRSCGRGLQPNEKNRIVRRLIADGILDRKKNDSRGGRGWVYWIADVNRARSRFPALERFVG